MSEAETKLDDAILDQIVQLCRVGDDHLDNDAYDKAHVHYQQAWALLPEPKTDWDTATWIQAAIGDAYFFEREFAKAGEAFRIVSLCPGGVGNPFLHLRRGQIAFELGDLDRAGQELTLAYMGDGRDIFKDEDPKYFNYLKTILQPPVGEKEL
jgi:hypothetical protein